MNSTPGKKPEAAKPEPAKKAAFEQSLARLEEIVRKLESANLPLDEAMKLFEEGMQLSRDCQKQLEQAEARVAAEAATAAVASMRLKSLSSSFIRA